MPCCAPLLACPCLPPRHKRMSPRASKSLGRSGMMHVPWLTTVPLGHVVLDLCLGSQQCFWGILRPPGGPCHHHMTTICSPC